MSIYKLTAEQLAPDILLLLELYREKKLQEAIVRQALRGACWWGSNARNRNDACNLWSKKALALRQANSSWGGIGLIHEHIVPRSVIEEAIINLEHPTEQEVGALLKLSRVCVVTPDEDATLRKLGLRDSIPEADTLYEGGVRRYVLGGIELSEVSFAQSDA
ncbi:MAG: hypothetical protein KF892_23420 [Rhizobacter sp.]|nr:hypothetical protein [Rhizobacter sp.]